MLSLGAGLVAMLIALFHPLRFDLNLRGSIRGQKAQLWFVYLFKIFKVGIIATPHTQDLVIKIFFWQKLIKRNQRQKPRPKPESEAKYEPKPPEPPPEPPFEVTSKPESFPDKEIEQKAPEVEDKPEEFMGPEELEPQQIEAEPEIGPEKTEEEKPVVEARAEENQESEEYRTHDIPEEIVVTNEIEQTKPETPTPELQHRHDENASEKQTTGGEAKIKPLDEVDPFAKTETASSAKKQVEHKADKGNDTWRARFRQIRRRVAQKYSQAKKWIRILGRKYRLLSPVFFKFWNRSKKGFKIDQPAVMCRYALHEPYLTGMFQGNLAIFSGILQRFGIDFVSVPVFTSPTLYTRAKASLVLLPYRFIFALIALFFERVLWAEAWKLFKWYRSLNSKATA